MKNSALLTGETTSPLLPLAAILFAVAVFVIDTFTPLGIAVAVLYVVVVLMAGQFFQRPGVLIVGFACIALTILSYVVQHGETYGPALIRCLVSIAAIAITTFLALRIQSAGTVLREQADLLETTHDAIFVRDMNDVITFWNHGAEELYGWPRDEAIGKISHELIRTVFPAPLQDIKAALIRDNRWEGELIHTKRDGSEVVVASRWSIQRNRAGRPLAILETNNDITERKRAENALRRSEANLAEAQRLSKTGSFAWDVTSGKVRWSEEAYRIFEHDPKVEPTLELVKTRTHPDDRPSFVTILERVMRERTQNWELEHRIVMADGRIKNIHVVAHAGEALDRLEYIGALMDITDAKQAQEALQQTQAELAHITRVTTLGELDGLDRARSESAACCGGDQCQVFAALARAQACGARRSARSPSSASSRTPTARARLSSGSAISPPIPNRITLRWTSMERSTKPCISCGANCRCSGSRFGSISNPDFPRCLATGCSCSRW